jgi:F0F1-type ATP synthase delta subunit
VAQLPKNLTAEQRNAIMKLLAKKKGVDASEIRNEIAQILRGGSYVSKGGYITKKKKGATKNATKKR